MRVTPRRKRSPSGAYSSLTPRTVQQRKLQEQLERERDDGSSVNEGYLCCSRSFQVILYFTFWYDLLHAAVHFVATWYKHRWIQEPWVWVFMVWNWLHIFAFEPFRMYLGYTGNL